MSFTTLLIFWNQSQNDLPWWCVGEMLEWCHLLAAITDIARTVLIVQFHKSKAHSIRLRQSALMSANNAESIHRKSHLRLPKEQEDNSRPPEYSQPRTIYQQHLYPLFLLVIFLVIWHWSTWERTCIQSEILSLHLSQCFTFGFIAVLVHEWENYSDLFTWKLSRQIKNILPCIAWTSYGGGNEKSYV